MQKRSASLGLVLFFVYLTFYSVFVGISAFHPATMETIVVAGLNAAIVWGFGLIFLALLLSAVYGWMLRESSAKSGPQQKDGVAE